LVVFVISHVDFPGNDGYDQQMKIFKMFGTPTEEQWPDLTYLKNYSPSWPKFNPPKNGIAGIFSGAELSEAPSELIRAFEATMVFNPVKRWTAHDTLFVFNK
jgi:hypothetical protein